MKKIVIILLGLIVYCACQDEDDNISPKNFDVSFSEFQDPRDMNTYKCITIGGQTWMAENLRYRSTQGGIDGCYTWGEEDIKPEEINEVIKINEKLWVDSLNAGIERGEFNESYMGFMFASDFVKMFMPPNYSPAECITTFKAYYESLFPNAVLTLERIYNNLFSLAFVERYNLLESKNGGYSTQYGLLYTYEGALLAVPEGWRLPTDEDWKKLEGTLGMPVSELDLLDEWRGSEADLLKAGEQGIGFNANYAGGKLAGPHTDNDDAYHNQGFNAYFWTATKMVEQDTVDMGITRILSLPEKRILRGTSKLEGAAYSVRCIKK